jgi:hypothetical protein
MGNNKTTQNVMPMDSKKWTKHTFYGWLIGFVAVVGLALVFEAVGLADTQLFIGLGMGLSIGYFQFRIISKTLNINILWMWYSGLGLSIPFLLYEFTPLSWQAQQMSYSLIWMIPIGSLLIGVLQSRLLQGKVKKPLLWIPTCIVGWTLAVALATLSDYNILPKLTGLWGGVITLLFMLSGGWVLGIVQGRIVQNMVKKD